MLLVTSAVKTVLSISRNRMGQITLNKQLSNHLNKGYYKCFQAYTKACPSLEL